MAAIKVKLVKGLAGCSHQQRTVVQGMGLGKTNSTAILPDTPSTLGMIDKVGFLLTWERVDAAPPTNRTQRRSAKRPAKAQATR